jgi:dynactin complex subunit
MKVNINVPDSLNEITLYQYQRFEKLIQENEASHFVNQKTIEIFCNIELKDVARIRIADIDDLLLHLNNLLQQKPKLTKTFKLGVYEFGFIPKLEDMTSGEFIDLENYLSSTESLHQAMAVLFRPIKSKVKDLYTIEDYESSYKYAEVLKYMPLDIALGAMN